MKDKIPHNGSNSSNPHFPATTELWSLGVTLYHLAAGQLPFRPFNGRKDRDLLHKLTTEKAPGIISGIQETENGPILWSKKLPETTKLSKNFRPIITKFFSSLLEHRREFIWSFPTFFAEVERILALRKIEVLNVAGKSAEIDSIWIPNGKEK